MTQTPERNLYITIGAALLDRVVARVKAAGTAASVTADELAQLRIELRNAGGDLVANGPDRFIVPDGKGGSIEVVVDETGDTIATPELGALAEFPKAEIIRLLQFTHAQCARLETELSRSKAALSAKLETEVAADLGRAGGVAALAAAIKANDKLVGMLARALWTGERCTTVERKVPAGEAGPPLRVFVTTDPATMARTVLEGIELTEGKQEVEATKAEIAQALDSYGDHAPTLLLAAVKCERVALLDPARAGEWIERSGRLRELARAASAIGC